MSQISLKSITGITSITTPAGVDNQFTLHNNNTTEAVKLDNAGNLHFHNHLNITGVSTASNFKTGTSNLHNTGLNVQDLDVDGHAELDNVNIVGVTTHNGQAKFYGNGGASLIWGDTGYSGHLSFDGSNNAVIRAASGKALILQTNHVNERLRILSNGNIGINESSPDNKLHVRNDNSAAVKIGGEGGSPYYMEIGQLTTSSSPGLNATGSGASMLFKMNGSEKFRIGPSGQFGLNGANYGTSGQVLTSQGNSATPTWTTVDKIFEGNTEVETVDTGSDGHIKFTTEGTERARIDSDGLRIGTVSAPTLPTTGVTPMIMRSATNFTKEVHRTISDYRGVGDGTHYGYLLLVPAWPGSNQPGKKFYGTIMCDRGSTGSGNSTQVARVHASTAYDNDKLIVEVDTLEQYIIAASKVTYSGVTYLALKFGNGGGGPNHGIHIDGIHRGTDSNFLKLLRGNEVTVVDDYYGSYNSSSAFMPACGMFVTGQPGSSYDGGVLTGGTVKYQYAPAGQSSPYNSSNGEFTARVSGIYLVTGSVLVQTGTGRLEAILEYYNGSSWSNYVAFNGTGTTYDGPTFTCMIPLKEGYKLRIARQSGNAYNSGHPQTYFGVHLLNGLRRQDVSL